MECGVGRAVREESGEILAIYRSHIGRGYCTWNEFYPGEEEIESDIANGALYRLRQGGIIVAVASVGAFGELGALQWRAKLKRPYELARIAVLPEMCARGLGGRMLDLALGVALGEGADGVRMLVSEHNLPAMRMYERAGFYICGRARMYDMDWLTHELAFQGGI